MSIDMDIVGVMAAYSARGACVVHFLYSELHTRTTGTDYIHVNGHDGIVILAKYCIRLPDDGSFMIQKMSKQF